MVAFNNLYSIFLKNKAKYKRKGKKIYLVYASDCLPCEVISGSLRDFLLQYAIGREK